MKKPRGEKTTSKNTARNKIVSLKRELVYAGGSRVDFLHKRIAFWEGKS